MVASSGRGMHFPNILQKLTLIPRGVFFLGLGLISAGSLPAQFPDPIEDPILDPIFDPGDYLDGIDFDYQLNPAVIGSFNDFEVPEPIPKFDPNILDTVARASERLVDLPEPGYEVQSGYLPEWDSVVLFFNLDSAAQANADDYNRTTVSDARRWLDEGNNPADPTVSEYVAQHFGTLSYGDFSFGIDTPRDGNGDPLIPTLSPSDDDPGQWAELINRAIKANPEAVWEAGGSQMKDGKRYIPSVVIVRNYGGGASANYGSFTVDAGGKEYLVGDRHNLTYGQLGFREGTTARKFWDTLVHEYGHNFLHVSDFYGPEGSYLYWDLFGDASAPGEASEIFSQFKVDIGWIDDFKAEIRGAPYGTISHSLQPYTTSGEAIKVVPDPDNNPHEFFLLEYRKPTGNEVWRPDGGLPEEGLLISHFNTRVGNPPTWSSRNAPMVDPEFADFSDNGGPLRGASLSGVLYPQGERNAFTPETEPSSDFYGGRASGLHITDIRVEDGALKFDLRIDETGHLRSWTTGPEDKSVVGRFTSADPDLPEEVFIHDGDNSAILQHRDAKWFVRHEAGGSIGEFGLDATDRMTAGDYDNDGMDEIFVVSTSVPVAGILEWNGSRLAYKTGANIQTVGWTGGIPESLHSYDIDGDDKEEVVMKSATGIGLAELTESGFDVKAYAEGSIGSWTIQSEQQVSVGTFAAASMPGILVRDANQLALLHYARTTDELIVAEYGSGGIDGWNLGNEDRHVAGDFDGDGTDEIFIRSNNWAGLIKRDTSSRQFVNPWIRNGNILYEEDEDESLNLKATDELLTGTFVADQGVTYIVGDLKNYRSGVIMVDRDPEAEERLSLLVWDEEDGKMVVRHPRKGGLLHDDDHFNWSEDARLVVGDFHRTGGDPYRSGRDFLGDDIDDILIHNDWGTAMLSVNVTNFKDNGQFRREMGVTWFQKEYLMNISTPRLEILEPAGGLEYQAGDDVTFEASLAGFDDPQSETIRWAYREEEGSYQTIGDSRSGESFVARLPCKEGMLIRAKVVGKDFAQYTSVTCEPPRETFVYNAAKEDVGLVRSDGTVTEAVNERFLNIGDTSLNEGTQLLVRFPLLMNEDLAEIESAELTLNYHEFTGNPFSGLFDLEALQVDFGEAIDSSDTRANLQYLPGRSTFPADRSRLLHSTSVLTAVQDAWADRDQRGNQVQFTVRFTQQTDNDGAEDSLTVTAYDELERFNLIRPTLELTVRNYDAPADRTWSSYVILNDRGDVNTESLAGWINVASAPWAWSYEIGTYQFLREDLVSDGGGWTYVQNNGPGPQPPTKEGWAGYPFESEQGDINLGDGFLGYVNVTFAPWVWSYAYSKFVYLPEDNVQNNGAWVFLRN